MFREQSGAFEGPSASPLLRLTSTGQDVARTSFTTADKGYSLTVVYRQPVVGTRVSAAWIRNETHDEPKQISVAKEFTLDADAVKHSTLTFDITTASSLAAGDYHIDVSVNGAMVKTVPFTVVPK